MLQPDGSRYTYLEPLHVIDCATTFVSKLKSTKTAFGDSYALFIFLTFLKFCDEAFCKHSLRSAAYCRIRVTRLCTILMLNNTGWANHLEIAADAFPREQVLLHSRVYLTPAVSKGNRKTVKAYFFHHATRMYPAAPCD